MVMITLAFLGMTIRYTNVTYGKPCVFKALMYCHTTTEVENYLIKITYIY